MRRNQATDETTATAAAKRKPGRPRKAPAASRQGMHGLTADDITHAMLAAMDARDIRQAAREAERKAAEPAPPLPASPPPVPPIHVINRAGTITLYQCEHTLAAGSPPSSRANACRRCYP